VHIYKHLLLSRKGRRCIYRGKLDGEEIPIDWHDATELELAFRKRIDETGD
jgi:hypothetical protein